MWATADILINLGRRSRILVASAALALAAFALVHCTRATEVVLTLTTDVPCANVQATAVTSGAPGSTENAAPTVVTTHCDNGDIGTLTLVPQSSLTAPLAVKVVLAVEGNVESCTAENRYAGCIVSRRLLGYREHESLRLRIPLNLVCRGVACDESTTCSRLGTCIDARTDAEGRLIAEDLDAAAPSDDARREDASVARDGTADADASPPFDDAGPEPDFDGGPSSDAGPEAGPRCGDAGARCATGQQCCNGVESAGTCGTCTGDGVVQCTGRSSCGAGLTCCEYDKGSTYTTCRLNPICGGTYWENACETLADCPDSSVACVPRVGAVYRRCQ